MYSGGNWGGKTSLARSKDTCDETGDESSGSIQGSGEESDEEDGLE